MRKLFEIIGLLSLACFSFYLTEKTTLVFENVDNIMIKIKEKSNDFNMEPMDAIINDNTIVPGKYGRVVNIKKSYKKMKKYGEYNENMYVYDYIKPQISLSDNLDKYIINGNKQNRYISLIFKVNDRVNDVKTIINKYKFKTTFFINSNWFENNNDFVIELIKLGHNIGNLSNNLDYNDSSFGWMDTIIKSLTNQKKGFCYYQDNINIENCIKYKNYIIKPIEINNNLLFEVKKILRNGIILSFDINSKLIQELESIINYIYSKGYEIVNLEKLVEEK